MKHNEDLIKKIGQEVEEEYGMGGLSDGLYMDFAMDVAKRYRDASQKQDKNPLTYKQILVEAIDRANGTYNIVGSYSDGGFAKHKYRDPRVNISCTVEDIREKDDEGYFRFGIKISADKMTLFHSQYKTEVNHEHFREAEFKRMINWLIMHAITERIEEKK